MGVAAARAVWRESDQAIPFLLEQTKNKDVAARAVAALGKIKNIGLKGEERVLAVLVDKSIDVRTRAAAATAVGDILSTLMTEKMLKGLSDALSSPDRQLRIAAAEARGKFRKDAVPYRGRLDPLLDDLESGEVRAVAALAAYFRILGEDDE